MDIALCYDDNYAPYATVVMSSVIDHNPEEEITFHVLYTGLTVERCEIIRRWVEGFNGKKVCFYEMDKENFADFPIDDTCQDCSAYFRLYLGECLTQLDKVLYLDCDVVVNGSLKELWETDISFYALAGVRDRLNDYIRVYNRLGYPMEEGYINSGVLLVNLQQWRDQGFFASTTILARSLGSAFLKNHSQDIINALFHGEILMLPFRYNLLEYYLYEEEWLYLDRNYYPEIIEACKAPVIVHFCMPQKPWHDGCINPFKSLYYKYCQKTPWPEVALTHKVQKLSPKECKLGLYPIERKPTLRKNIDVIEENDNVLF